MNNKKFTQDRLPLSSDLCAVAPVSMLKVASLLFDKVFVATHSSDSELAPSLEDVPEEVTFGLEHLKVGSSKRLQSKLVSILPRLVQLHKIDDNAAVLDSVSNELGARSIAEEYIANGIAATPLYKSDASFSLGFPHGKTLAYQAAIENLPVVLNDSVTWDEILEFRKDKDAIRKYRAFRLWLAECIKAESLGHAQDLIAKRLDEYEWAIKKHGLKTATGALSQILNLKNISSLSVGTLSTGMLGGTILAAVAAGLIVGTNACVYIAERKIEREELDRDTFGDIALLHEAKQLLKSKS